MYSVYYTKSFKKDIKRAKKRGHDINELKNVMITLSEGKNLSQKYKDHPLSGKFKDNRECHIKPDFLLIYKIENNILIFIRTGTHSDLFE